MFRTGEQIVKMRFAAKPTIADYTFKDYKVSKQSKQTLKIGDDQRDAYEIFLKVESIIPTTSLLGDSVQACFAYDSLSKKFE